MTDQRLCLVKSPVFPALNRFEAFACNFPQGVELGVVINVF
jgi:hypothetical protein